MNKPQTAPKAILFDWDGTIADTEHILALALNATFADWAEKGYAKPEHAEWTTERIWGIPNFAPRRMLHEIFIEHGDDVAALVLDDYIRHYIRIGIETMIVYDGALANFHLLKQSGIAFAIVSSKYHPFLDSEVKAVLGEHFPDIVFVGDKPDYRPKPDPKPLLLALEQLGVAPGKDVWMIGDTVQSDMQGALNAGCTPIFMSIEGRRPEGCENFYIVEGHRSLRELIRGVVQQSQQPVIE